MESYIGVSEFQKKVGKTGNRPCKRGTRMKKEIKQYIEAELRDYQQSKKDLADLQEAILHGSASTDLSGIRGSGISDPTQRKALALITNVRIKKLEETIGAIESVLGELDAEKTRLVEMKYWTQPNHLTDEGIAQRLCISRRTLYDWTNKILFAIAVKMGLINGI